MIKKIFNLFIPCFMAVMLNLINPTYATEIEDTQETSTYSSCFLIKEKGYYYVNKGDCDSQKSPCCTFNIVSSMIGYDEGILINENDPIWPYNHDKYQSTRSILKQAHNPKTWMQHSCFWYTQWLVEILGKDKIEKHLELVNYGNKDLSGYKANDPLPRFWLASSLRISPLEQLSFLEKLVNSELPFTEEAKNFTQNILYIEELAKGWKLYGKTGAANMRNINGTEDEDRKFGWFVGWLQNDTRSIFFVRYLEAYMPGDNYPSAVAREEVKEKLRELVRKM